MSTLPNGSRIAVLAAMITAGYVLGDAWAGQKINSATPVPGPADCMDVEEMLIGTKDQYILMTANCNGQAEAWVRMAKEGSHAPSDTIIDHLAARQLSRSEKFSAGPYCYRNGIPIQWVAIYEWKGRKRISGTSGGIRQAWIVNLDTGRFEPAPDSLIRAAQCSAGEDE